MGKVVNDMPDLAVPAMIPGELGELLSQIEKETVPERLLDLAVQLQAALARRHVPEQADRAVVNG